MQCHEFNDRLQVVLDERRRPESDGELARHAAACGECRERLAAQRALFASLKILPLVPAHFAKDVVVHAELPQTGPVPPARASRWAWLAVAATATAAACLLSFSPAWNPRPAPPSEIASNHSDPTVGALAISQSNPAIHHPAPPQQAHQPAQPTAEATASSPSGLPSATAYEDQIRSWVHTLPDAVERIDDVNYLQVEEYAPGLRSLRTSFSLALETLRRSLPGSRDTLKSEGAQRILHPLTPA